ncbi:MAG: phytoene desaturase family protein, partial [Isosphaeraceae bacterium]
MSATKQVVIIGAGPGGLAEAMLLAAAGYRVKVLDRRDRVGGRTSAIESNGFRFDVGPTFFLYPRVLEAIYRAAGHELRDEIDLVRLDPQYHLIFGAGGELKATGDVARMQRAIAELSPHDAAQFPRFLAENRVKMDQFRPILESPFLGWTSLLSPHLARILPNLRPFRSLDAELGRYFHDPRVRLAMTFQSKYLGMSPFQCPSLFSILSFIEYEYGVFHPIDGCAAVTESMAGIARKLGVQIQLDDEVESIDFRGRRAVGVRSRSGYHPCDALV